MYFLTSRLRHATPWQADPSLLTSCIKPSSIGIDIGIVIAIEKPLDIDCDTDGGNNIFRLFPYISAPSLAERIPDLSPLTSPSQLA